MALTIVSAPDCLACDTSALVYASQAKVLAALSWQGRRIRGLAQYVPIRAASPGIGDITAEALQGQLAAGLGVWPVQHVHLPGQWDASAQLGSDMGGAAAEYAKKVGFLAGCNIGVDQEGCRTVGRPVADFLEAWAKEVSADGFGFAEVAYQGFASGLTPQQWYEWLPDVHLYWSDYGTGRSVLTRGFAIVQHAQQKFAELPFYVDLDDVKADQLGGRLQWMVDDAVYQTEAA